MLVFVAEAQHRLLLDLAERGRKIEAIASRIRVLLADGHFPVNMGLEHRSTPPVDRDGIGVVLFVLGQAHCFDTNRRVRLNALADAVSRFDQFIRPRLQRLDDAGIIETVTRKPLRFRLTPRGASLLELGGE